VELFSINKGWFVVSKEPITERANIDATPTFSSMETYLVDRLEPQKAKGKFDVVGGRIVRIEVDGFVWIKRGTVIAYHGQLKFHRENVLQSEGVKVMSGPARSTLKREMAPLVKAEGQGCLYVADAGAHSHVMRLEGSSIYMVSTRLLAFESTLEHEVRMVGGVGVLAGGIFVIKLSGNGHVAFGVSGDPMTMRVTPDDPVSTDPTATVAWTDSLWPELKTDLEIRSLVAHGGGEAIQMLFRGDGYVIVHAKSQLEAMRAGLIKSVTSKVKKLFV
jgi:uncharacterized protein (AIM24 family)